MRNKDVNLIDEVKVYKKQIRKYGKLRSLPLEKLMEKHAWIVNTLTSARSEYRGFSRLEIVYMEVEKRQIMKELKRRIRCKS